MNGIMIESNQQNKKTIEDFFESIDHQENQKTEIIETRLKTEIMETRLKYLGLFLGVWGGIYCAPLGYAFGLTLANWLSVSQHDTATRAALGYFCGAISLLSDTALLGYGGMGILSSFAHYIGESAAQRTHPYLRNTLKSGLAIFALCGGINTLKSAAIGFQNAPTWTQIIMGAPIMLTTAMFLYMYLGSGIDDFSWIKQYTKYVDPSYDATTDNIIENKKCYAKTSIISCIKNKDRKLSGKLSVSTSYQNNITWPRKITQFVGLIGGGSSSIISYPLNIAAFNMLASLTINGSTNGTTESASNTGFHYATEILGGMATTPWCFITGMATATAFGYLYDLLADREYINATTYTPSYSIPTAAILTSAISSIPWAYLVLYFAEQWNLEPALKYYLTSSGVLCTVVLRTEVIQDFIWELVELAPNGYGLDTLKENQKTRKKVKRAFTLIDTMPTDALDRLTQALENQSKDIEEGD